MPDYSSARTDHNRTALLRNGIIVLDAELESRSACCSVSAPASVDAEAHVRAELGRDVEVVVAGPLPREHRLLHCIGYREREPGRLQVRFVLRGDEHIDEIVVAEDGDSVVVVATVCVSVAGTAGEPCGVPAHVYLERPLGDRVVIDGTRDEPVPYLDVYGELCDALAGEPSAHSS